MFVFYVCSVRIAVSKDSYVFTFGRQVVRDNRTSLRCHQQSSRKTRLSLLSTAVTVPLILHLFSPRAHPLPLWLGDDTTHSHQTNISG